MAAYKLLTAPQERLITDLLEVASDWQADVLDELLFAARYWWRCPGHGYFRAGEACDVCGHGPTCRIEVLDGAHWIAAPGESTAWQPHEAEKAVAAGLVWLTGESVTTPIRLVDETTGAVLKTWAA